MLKKVKNLNLAFPQYLIGGNSRTVEVVGVSDGDPIYTARGDRYRESKGYVFFKEDFEKYISTESPELVVWIYAASKPLHRDIYPYFWVEYADDKRQEPHLVFSNPSKMTLNVFNVENMHDLTVVNVVKNTTPGEMLFSVKEISDMNSSANFYVPIIYEKDDFLKVIVKTTILEKGINVNKLRSKTSEKYTLANMIAALKNDTKMSVTYFCNWMELLNCEYTIRVRNDNYVQADLLDHPLVYDSEIGYVQEEIRGGKLKKLDPSRYAVPNTPENTDEEGEG